MDTKLFARIGAGAFVATALTMSLLQLREERPAPQPQIITGFQPDGDPLPARLRACRVMGELALSSPDCRAAWAEKRQRFLGVEASKTIGEPAAPATEDAAPANESRPAKGQ